VYRSWVTMTPNNIEFVRVVGELDGVKVVSSVLHVDNVA
jgi:hypothetical protein